MKAVGGGGGGGGGGDEERAVGVHTHASHGHAHGAVSLEFDSAETELLRHRVISQVNSMIWSVFGSIKARGVKYLGINRIINI